MASSTPSELESRPQGKREWSGWLVSLVLPLALVTAIVSGLLYLRSTANSSADGDFGSISLPSTKNATGLAPLAMAGRAAPDFLLRDLDGRASRLSDFQGRPVVVVFWASWCSNCRSVMPDLVSAYQSSAGELAILAVSVGETPIQSQSTADTFSIPFLLLSDVEGEVARTWNVTGGTQSLPAAFFIDNRGIIRTALLSGTLSADALDQAIVGLLRPDD